MFHGYNSKKQPPTIHWTKFIETKEGPSETKKKRKDLGCHGTEKRLARLEWNSTLGIVLALASSLQKYIIQSFRVDRIAKHIVEHLRASPMAPLGACFLRKH